MPIVCDYTVVVSSQTTVNETNDDLTSIPFSTGGVRRGAADHAALLIDFRWDGQGSDSAHFIVNDQRVGSVSASSQTNESRTFIFPASRLSGKNANNRFRVDVDSPTPNRRVIVNSAIVFFQQEA